MYDRMCQALSAREIAAREAAGEPRVVRMLVPDVVDTSFDDQVHGRISVPLEDGGADAALLVRVPPGAYTVHLVGQGAAPTGLALVEVYHVDPAAQ